MNNNILKAFNKELQKQAAISIAGTIGSGVEKLLRLAWKYPKTTISAVLAGIAIPKIIHSTFPVVILGSEARKHRVMDQQTEVMKGILNEERLHNKPNVNIKPRNIPITRPLV